MYFLCFYYIAPWNRITLYLDERSEGQYKMEYLPVIT